MFSTIKCISKKYISQVTYSNYFVSQKLENSLSKRTMANNQSGSHLVWMDLEMTGLDEKRDDILEVACLITDKDLNILNDGISFAIKQPKEVLDNMNDWCIKHHNETGLVQKCLDSNITTKEGESMLLKFLQENVPEKQCPLAGNSVYMDRLFLRRIMARVDAYLHYHIIDISTIKELCQRWNPQVSSSMPPKKRLHRSLDDIRESIEEIKYYKEHFLLCNNSR